MFAQFIAFLELEKIPILQVNTIALLSFMEFCYQSGLSQANISNHLCAIRAMFIVHGLNTEPFKDHRLPLYIKSLKINAVFQPNTSKLVLLTSCIGSYYCVTINNFRLSLKHCIFSVFSLL